MKMSLKSHLSQLNKTINLYKFQLNFYFTVNNELKDIHQRIYLTQKGKNVSFWHDIDLCNRNKETFNMVVEIPQKTKLKLEMCKEELFNPIKPDTKKDKNGNIICREYGIEPIFNYGFLPQTYENTNRKYRNLYQGDGDPLDVVEIGGIQNFQPGDIVQVKVLGCFCLIDQGEVDWKILAINKFLYNKDKHNRYSLAEILLKIQEWFRSYKVFEGKKENILLDNNKIFSNEETHAIIDECHKDYLLLEKKIKI